MKIKFEGQCCVKCKDMQTIGICLNSFCSCHHPQPEVNDWEEEFEKEFVATNPLSSGKGTYSTIRPMKSEKLKQFISQLLTQTRNETIEEYLDKLPETKRSKHTIHYSLDGLEVSHHGRQKICNEKCKTNSKRFLPGEESIGFNQAISEVKKSLEELIKK